ncbi:antitoxin [Calothrix sp. FACHB-1219]|uniref:antitoxin n=1 Tax=unclassified Calothrix TaxID=2619626 RepID=UPI001687D1B0|nr:MULTISPECIES: antitoxin [unclassified Calothrix]MBD2201722.1 antitoxin [Calothrix sp. FACHB-168]MBD2217408.1 antitoxin [Calothrix sp. FACHB-1219]
MGYIVSDEIEALSLEALEKWGLDSTLEQIVEECAEVIKAVKVYQRTDKGSDMDLVIEELADLRVAIDRGLCSFTSREQVYESYYASVSKLIKGLRE